MDAAAPSQQQHPQHHGAASSSTSTLHSSCHGPFKFTCRTRSREVFDDSEDDEESAASDESSVPIDNNPSNAWATRAAALGVRPPRRRTRRSFLRGLLLSAGGLACAIARRPHTAKIRVGRTVRRLLSLARLAVPGSCPAVPASSIPPAAAAAPPAPPAPTTSTPPAAGPASAETLRGLLATERKMKDDVLAFSMRQSVQTQQDRCAKPTDLPTIPPSPPSPPSLPFPSFHRSEKERKREGETLTRTHARTRARATSAGRG